MNVTGVKMKTLPDGLKAVPRYVKNAYLDNEVLYMFCRDVAKGKLQVLSDFTLVEKEPASRIDDSAQILLDKGAMQSMFDDMWAAGYRPSQKFGDTGPSDGIETQAHIADLRHFNDRVLDILEKRK